MADLFFLSLFVAGGPIIFLLCALNVLFHYIIIVIIFFILINFFAYYFFAYYFFTSCDLSVLLC